MSSSGRAQSQHFFIGDHCDFNTSILHASCVPLPFPAWGMGSRAPVPSPITHLFFCPWKALDFVRWPSFSQTEKKWWYVTKMASTHWHLKSRRVQMSSETSGYTWNLGMFPGFSHPPGTCLTPAVDGCRYWNCYQRPHLNPRDIPASPGSRLTGQSTAWPKIR